MVAISSSLLLEKRQLRQKTKKKWSLFLLLKMAPKNVSLHYCTLRRVSSNSASPVEAARCNKGSIPRQHWAESVVPTLYAGKDADFSIIFLETLFSSPSTHSSLAPFFSLFEISFLRLDSSRQRSGNYGHVLLVRRLGEEAASAALRLGRRSFLLWQQNSVESLVLQVVVFVGLLLPPAAPLGLRTRRIVVLFATVALAAANSASTILQKRGKKQSTTPTSAVPAKILTFISSGASEGFRLFKRWSFEVRK